MLESWVTVSFFFGGGNLQKDAQKHKHYFTEKDTTRFPTFFFGPEFYSARSLKSQIEHQTGSSVAGLVTFH